MTRKTLTELVVPHNFFFVFCHYCLQNFKMWQRIFVALRMVKNLNGFHLCFGLLKILHCSLCFFFSMIKELVRWPLLAPAGSYASSKALSDHIRAAHTSQHLRTTPSVSPKAVSTKPAPVAGSLKPGALYYVTDTDGLDYLAQVTQVPEEGTNRASLYEFELSLCGFIFIFDSHWQSSFPWKTASIIWHAVQWSLSMYQSLPVDNFGPPVPPQWWVSRVALRLRGSNPGGSGQQECFFPARSSQQDCACKLGQVPANPGGTENIFGQSTQNCPKWSPALSHRPLSLCWQW